MKMYTRITGDEDCFIFYLSQFSIVFLKFMYSVKVAFGQQIVRFVNDIVT